MNNYPAGVSDSHPHFWPENAPEYSYSDACSWIDSKELYDDFAEYVEEHFPEVIALFVDDLHPAAVPENNCDVVSENYDLWQTFLWEALEKTRLRALVQAFAESNWEDYQEFAS